MLKLDDLDREIIKLLKEDARLTISEISSKLGKPESTIHFRIKKLQERGVIEKYTIILGDEVKPKYMAFLVLRVEKPVIEDFLERYLEYITKTLSMLPNVLAVAKSKEDYIVALVGEETQEKLESFIEDNIKTIPTLKEVLILPVREFKKGKDLIGFLAEI